MGNRNSKTYDNLVNKQSNFNSSSTTANKPNSKLINVKNKNNNEIQRAKENNNSKINNGTLITEKQD